MEKKNEGRKWNENLLKNRKQKERNLSPPFNLIASVQQYLLLLISIFFYNYVCLFLVLNSDSLSSLCFYEKPFWQMITITTGGNLWDIKETSLNATRKKKKKQNISLNFLRSYTRGDLCFFTQRQAQNKNFIMKFKEDIYKPITYIHNHKPHISLFWKR